VNHPPILLGTSSFTASGWNGSFYPRGMKPSDYLWFYAERFHTVEGDSTFYACPSARTVENWNARTPDAINTETFERSFSAYPLKTYSCEILCSGGTEEVEAVPSFAICSEMLLLN